MRAITQNKYIGNKNRNSLYFNGGLTVFPFTELTRKGGRAFKHCKGKD